MTRRRKPAKLPAISPPTTPFDDHVLQTMGHEFDMFVAQIRAGDSHRYLQGWIKKLVREGRITLRRVIEYTRDPNWAPDADEALRDIAEEMRQQREPLPDVLQFYLICFPKPTRGRGRVESDNFKRDQCIAIYVSIARERWPFILFTRNPATSAPSICSHMSRVCRARGIRIDEKRVKQIYDRFVEFLPQHQNWLQNPAR